LPPSCTERRCQPMFGLCQPPHIQNPSHAELATVAAAAPQHRQPLVAPQQAALQPWQHASVMATIQHTIHGQEGWPHHPQAQLHSAARRPGPQLLSSPQQAHCCSSASSRCSRGHTCSHWAHQGLAAAALTACWRLPPSQHAPLLPSQHDPLLPSVLCSPALCQDYTSCGLASWLTAPT
jgi:hypothetical protein